MEIRVELGSRESGRMVTAEKIVSALGDGGREGRKEKNESEEDRAGMDGQTLPNCLPFSHPLF